MKANMVSQNMYLDCITEDYQMELTVCAIASDKISNFKHLSDTMTIAQFSGLKEQYKSNGIDLYKTEIYKNDQAKYAILYLKNTYGYSTAFYTVYNGICIIITFNNLFGSFSASDLSKCHIIIDSVRFDNDGNKPVAGTCPSFLYTDSETGTSFTLPDNWKEKAFSEPRTGLDVLFVSTVDSVVSIMYGSTDIYDEALADDPTLKREDIDISKMSEEDLHDFISGLSAINPNTDDFKRISYNGTEYLFVKCTQKTVSYGAEVEFEFISLCTIRDGYCYVFTFGESDDSLYYNDFITLMNSVRYADKGITVTTPPTTQAPAQQATEKPVDSAGNGNKHEQGLKTGHILILATLAFIVFFIATLLIVNAVKKRKSKNAVSINGKESPRSFSNNDFRHEDIAMESNQMPSELKHEKQVVHTTSVVSTNHLDNSDNSMEIAYNKALNLLRMPTKENIDSALAIMEKLANEDEYLPAINWMGEYSENVLGDYKQAMEWFKKAAMRDKSPGKTE